MPTELLQKRFFTKRKVTINDNRITYNEVIFGQEKEYNIAYEDLVSPESFTSFRIEFLIGAIVFALLTLVMFLPSDEEFDLLNQMLWFISFLVCGALYFITRESVWRLRHPVLKKLFILKNTPNRVVVEEFIDELMSARNSYMRDMYLYLDRKVAYDKQLGNLNWLRKMEVLKKEEFDIKKEELTKFFDEQNKPIGFIR